MLPGGPGAELLAWVRQNLGCDLPLIVVTARDDEAAVCAAMGAGADDHVVKPARQGELLARIDAAGKPGNIGLRSSDFAADGQGLDPLCGEFAARRQAVGAADRAADENRTRHAPAQRARPG
jgi:DNA-binding response OmpR family regulator